MMEQKERRRSTGKVDRLPPELKDTVEQMLSLIHISEPTRP